MKQKIDNVLAVSFTCPTTIAVNDIAILNTTASKTVKKNDAAGSVNYVGRVSAHLTAATTCTVDTKFRERRDDRLSGAAFAATGPFVWNASHKAIPYNSSTHDPSAIAGLCLTICDSADDVIETLEY